MIVRDETRNQLVCRIERNVCSHNALTRRREDPEDPSLVIVVIVHDQIGRRRTEMKKTAVFGNDSETRWATFLSNALTALFQSELAGP